jgi:nucleoside-diphosphate-sugar epimerase
VNLLVLGGTEFLGRALVEAALARGQELTLFNRGQTNPDLFPEVEKLHGARDGGLDALRGRTWDGVLDTSGYVPRIVRDSAELLADAAGQYTFVSSIAVYRDFREPPDEDYPVGVLTEETEEPTNLTYGPLKALCEDAVRHVFGRRALVVRPGLIAGPHDPTDRFTYWPRRIERGGPLLAPAPPERPMQLIDVRDLAAWMLQMVERGASGTFNATSPPRALTFGSMLEACGAGEVVWVSEEFLLERGIEEWRDLPLWMSSRDPAWRSFLLTDVSRAVAAGLAFRPLAETARDVPEWTGNAGLAPEREAELLEAWKAAV